MRERATVRQRSGRLLAGLVCWSHALTWYLGLIVARTNKHTEVGKRGRRQVEGSRGARAGTPTPPSPPSSRRFAEADLRAPASTSTLNPDNSFYPPHQTAPCENANILEDSTSICCRKMQRHASLTRARGMTWFSPAYYSLVGLADIADPSAWGAVADKVRALVACHRLLASASASSPPKPLSASPKFLFA